MDAPSVPSTDSWSHDFARALGDGRRHVEEFLTAQRLRLDHLEEKISHQLQNIAEQLAHREAAGDGPEGSNQQAAQLAAEATALARLKDDLTRRQAEWEAAQDEANRQHQLRAEQLRRRHEELEAGQRELEAAEAHLRQSRRDLTAEQEEWSAAKEQLARTREQLERQRQQLDEQTEQLANEQTETRLQRRRIAREFQEQRAVHHKELDRRRQELERLQVAADAEVARQLATAQAERDEARTALAALQQRLDERRAEIEGLLARINQQTSELETLRSAHDALSQQLACSGARAQGDSSTATPEVADLISQRDALIERLADAEQRLANLSKGEADSRKKDDLQRRFEMAVEDVRELKRKNAELEQKLAKATAGQSPAAIPATGGRLDWEAQKKRLLAALESDFDENDEDDAADRLTIEGTIRITDQVVAEKDREIAELKQLLEEQSNNLGSVAVGAAAVAAVLDHDELIQQERKRLTELQDEWREKVRRAEIDISVERAKFARQRAELEEKLAALQSAHDRDAPETHDNSGDKPSKPGRRWLTRLGIKDLEE